MKPHKERTSGENSWKTDICKLEEKGEVGQVEKGVIGRIFVETHTRKEMKK